VENIFNWNIVKPGYCNHCYNEFMAVQIKYVELYGLNWLLYYINHGYNDWLYWCDGPIKFNITEFECA
jgi:hypothetical protein